MKKVNIHYIDDQDSLYILCQKIKSLSSNEYIAIDTEFERISSYYPILSIIQLAINDQAYIVDAIALNNLKDFIICLRDTKASCLFFSGIEDMEILVHLSVVHCGERFLPNKLLDIQLLNMFYHSNGVVGLSKLLKQELNIDISKDQTLSNWLQRPLELEQLNYAVNDVIYLYDLYHTLKQKVASNNYIYFECECNNRKQECLKEISDDEAYLYIAGAGKLNTLELTRLKYLCSLRQAYAKKHNIALNWVITTGALVSLCTKRCYSIADIAKAGVKHGAIKQNGNMILQWLKQTYQLKPQQDIALAYDLFYQKREYAGVLHKLKALLTHIAKKHEIDPSMFASKKIIADLMYSKYVKKQSYLEGSWQWPLCSEVADFIKID